MAGLEEAITHELGVPVVDGIGAAVRLAEAVVGLGLKTSNVAASDESFGEMENQLTPSPAAFDPRLAAAPGPGPVAA
jgi:hypothetical protein